MSIISDFEDINRRMNRKPEKVVAVTEGADSPASHVAAIRTLLQIGYTYTPGAQEWRRPLGKFPWIGGTRQVAAPQGQAANLAGQYTKTDCVMPGYTYDPGTMLWFKEVDDLK